MITVPIWNTEYLGFHLQIERNLDWNFNRWGTFRFRQSYKILVLIGRKCLLYLRKGIEQQAKTGIYPEGASWL